MMFGKLQRDPAHSGEIALRDAFTDLPNDAIEIARFWVNSERSFVAVGQLQQWEPELLGSLLVESVHTAAAGYAAQAGMSEQESLARMWNGFDEERERLTFETPKDAH